MVSYSVIDIFFHVMLCCVMLCYVISYYIIVIVCHIILCCVVLCYIISYNVMLFYVMLCIAVALVTFKRRDRC